jgi:hypothetical protein
MTTIHPGRHRHHKGIESTVIGVAPDGESQEEPVVCRQEFGDHGPGVRPEPMFPETDQVEGRAMPRFQYVGGQE